MRSFIIPTAYSNLCILSKKNQAKNRTENQASKVTNWPFLANPFRFNQAARCWKSPFPFSRRASSGNSSQTAKITERCRAQHVLPAAQEQTQSSVLRMLGRSGESRVGPSSPPTSLLHLLMIWSCFLTPPLECCRNPAYGAKMQQSFEGKKPSAVVSGYRFCPLPPWWRPVLRRRDPPPGIRSQQRMCLKLYVP